MNRTLSRIIKLALWVFVLLVSTQYTSAQLVFKITAESSSSTTITISGSGTVTTNSNGFSWNNSNGFNQIFGNSSFNYVNSNLNFKTFSLTGDLQLSDGVTPISFSGVVLDDDTGIDYDDFALNVSTQTSMSSNTSYTLSGSSTFDIAGTATFGDLTEGTYAGTFDGLQAGFNNFSTSDITIIVQQSTLPNASSVTFSGDMEVGETLTGSYVYSDPQDDPESGTTYQWYVSDDASGTNKTAISGATDTLYTITSIYEKKYLSFEVTPSDGTDVGAATESTRKLVKPHLFGEGTQENPYHISSADELNNVRYLITAHFIQTKDIDLDTTGFNTGSGWEPIGTNTSGKEFSGTFNGNGFTISNLFIDRSSTNFNGLFGATKNAVLKNIALENVNITGDEYTGALVGINYSEIRNSYSTGSVSGYNHTGGLAGAVETWDGSTGLVTNSYSHATVSGSNYGASSLVGRLISGTIEYSFGTGSVTASSGSGGLIGEKNSGTVTSSYWDTQTTGQASSAGGTGLNTAQMQQSSNFAGFDFNDKWSSIDGKEYPYLQTFGYKKTGISGDDGWRMLSAPVSGTSYGTLLDSLWTQGFTGADYSNGTSNVYTWNESNQVFESISNATDEPATGKGFITYVFSDDNGPDATGDAGFPKVLTNSETQFSGTVNPAITFTDSGTLADDGWNLLGNPYGTSINWDASNGWSRTNIDGTFYVWSDSASEGAGAYLTWNGTTGTLEDGKIAPWQGFWVKANAAGPSISMNDSVKSTGGILFKQKQAPQLRFRLSGNEMSNSTVVMFDELALEGKDKLDAYKLNSLNKDFLLLSTVSVEGKPMDIQALPVNGNEFLLELDIKGSALNGNFSLSWDLEEVPNNWEIILIDREEETETRISTNSSVEFKLNNTVKSKESNKLSSPASPIQVLSISKENFSRFAVLIRQGISVNTEPLEDLPQNMELEQNYPNPFNPSTTIAYGVPNTGKVTLEVFDILGRKVATLLNGENKTAGRYTLHFNASNLASGMYIYRLRAGNVVMIKKFTLIK
ncbi:MAG: T9SS type A sorting domain-containing protein [Balneola sp.]